MTVQNLYKYGKINEYSEGIFSSPTIWFSPAAELNDPFECRPWFTFDGTKEQIVQLIARGLQHCSVNLTPKNATAHAVGIFLEGRYRDSNVWGNVKRDIADTLLHKIGLYCLSKNCDNILMWAHYAENHRGYCLEFEATDYTPVFGMSQEVKYAADCPVVDIFNTSPEEKALKSFLTKFSGWSYEEEWRIVDHVSGPGVRKYPPELLRSVIFGLRMSEADRAKIRTWVKKRGHEVKFCQAVPDDRQVKIIVKNV